MFKKTLIIVVVVLSALLLSACSETDSINVDKVKDDAVYKIGFITALTGSEEAFGQQQKAILDYRLVELNKRNSFQVELLVRDGGCDVSTATAVFRELLEKEKVHFIIGGHCSAATSAMAQIANEYDVVLLSASTSNDDLEGVSDNVMTLSYKETLLAHEIAKELMNYEKVAVLYEDGGETEVLERNIDNFLHTEGKEDIVIFDQGYARGETDFPAHVQQVKELGAEALFLNPSSKESALALLAKLKEAGVETELIGQFTYNDSALIAESDGNAEGMLIIDNPTSTSHYFAKYKDKLEDNVGPLTVLGDYYTASTLDALDILVKLISENNGDYESVQKALSTGSFTGNIGKIQFNGNTFVEGLSPQRILVTNGGIVAQ